MTKSTEIINHLTGLDSETQDIVGTTGQVQLIKKEDDKRDMHEFYDTEAEATAEADAWKAEIQGEGE
jgi:hypothetical protein